MISTKVGTGTAFSVDIDDREYWLTAKHLFTGANDNLHSGEVTAKTVEAKILLTNVPDDAKHDQRWVTQTFNVIDPGKDIDILVLAPKLLFTDYPRGFSLKAQSKGIGIGGDCEFLGYPFGLGWKALIEKSWIWLPFVKHCTPSGQLRSNEALIWLLDGINNHGFSGGPVLSGTGETQNVFAVVSGFYSEALEVVPVPGQSNERSNLAPSPRNSPGSRPAKPQKQIVNANSGLMIAFDIDIAIKAIQKNPIGPLRPDSLAK